MNFGLLYNFNFIMDNVGSLQTQVYFSISKYSLQTNRSVGAHFKLAGDEEASPQRDEKEGHFQRSANAAGLSYSASNLKVACTKVKCTHLSG